MSGWGILGPRGKSRIKMQKAKIQIKNQKWGG
jgi:hypothetical protein